MVDGGNICSVYIVPSKSRLRGDAGSECHGT